MAKSKNILKFNSPSKWWGAGWREALVSGNGKIGASVLGGAGEDSIMLTHADLWWQGRVGVLPDVCSQLDKVQKALDEGRHKEATAILPDALQSKGYNPLLSYPLPICDFKVNHKMDRPPKEYNRTVNMDSGEVTVSFKDGATRFERSVFVSKNEDMVVFEIKKFGAKAIDADFRFDVHEKFNTLTPTAKSNMPEGTTARVEGKFLLFSARSDGGEYGAVAYVNFFGGTIANTQDAITVRGAEKVFIIIKPFINAKSREMKWKELKDELKGFKNTYEKLLKEQNSAFGRVFNRAFVELDDENGDESVDRLIADVAEGGEISPAMIEKLWAFGRYLFISSTTPNSAPTPPYGIFCGDYKGINSHINADGSLQLSYEHALAGNLTDYFESLLEYYKQVIDDLKKNAIRLYNARGIMVPSVMARGTGLLGSLDAAAVHFTGAAGWLCKLFYDACLCSGETKWLKTEVMPLLKETAQFYLEFFKEGEGGMLESKPSWSPMSEFNADGVRIAKNAFIDFAIAKEVFCNLISASEELGANKADIAKWKEFMAKIPYYSLNNDGTVKEFNDPKAVQGITNGSTSVFYPLYPSTKVSDINIEEFKQFEKTAKERFSFGSHHSTMSLARYANLFIRLNQTKQAEDIIAALVANTAYSNLIFSASDWTGMGIANNDGWAQFNIETNLILTNAIQEMFLRSDKENIWLLPACTANKGSIGGFLTRSGVEVVELTWNYKKGEIFAKLKAKKACKINIRLPEIIKKYKGIGTIDAENMKLLCKVDLPGGKAIAFDFKI